MKSTERFVTTVFEYCVWCEQPAHELSEARALLLRLLLGVAEIRGVESDQLESIVIDDDHFELQLGGESATAFDQLRDLPIQYYTQTFEPLDLADMKAVVGDLLDDLADIYRDLYEGIVEWQFGTPWTAFRQQDEGRTWYASTNLTSVIMFHSLSMNRASP